VSTEDRAALIAEYYATKDFDVREALVESYRPLVEYISRKLAFNREDLDDVIQVGMMGLLRALDHFDISKSIDFSTFATPNIVGEIRHYFRDKHHVVKVPRKMQENYSKIRSYMKTFESDVASPTVAMIATHLDMDEETVLEAMEAGRSTSVISLDLPTYSEAGSRSGSESSETLVDTLGTEEKEDAILEYSSLRELVNGLPDREQDIIRLRYYQGYSQREIADVLGLSQMHVSRLLNQILRKLKKQIKS